MKKKLLVFISSGLFLTLVLLGSLYTFSFRLIGSKKIEVSIGEEYIDQGFKANVLSLSLEKYVKVKNNVDTTKLGKYKVVYELPFKTLTREIEVLDQEAPILTLKGEDVVVLGINEEYIESGFEVVDNVDLNLDDKVVVTSNLDSSKIGEYKIKYSVSDNSKNETIKERIIKVIDNIAPVISLKGSKNITVKLNESYSEDGYTATDNLDGDLTDKVQVSKNIDYSKVGTYYINYSVSDSSLNQVTETRVVNVIEQVEITYIKGILLVNKKYHLPYNYNPGVNGEAYSALTRLQHDASSNGYSLPLLSGFRSYETQKYLFNSYVKKDGVEKASTYSARPGESEHQTGLAFDVGMISDNFGNTSSGIWLRDNAHKYGFIIRYLKGKENITGYKYEPWHIRYVGENVATEIYNMGVTLEEYLGVN